MPSPSRSTHHHNVSLLSISQEGSTPDEGASVTNGHAYTHKSKDHNAVDWFVEGPGRRVGYDDMTAIDWIFEYAKERQRLRTLYSKSTGPLGYIQQLLDGTHIWTVLICTGITSGILAACIDIVSDWLGDLKMGYCANGPGGGKFYLNRCFCCWGLEGKKQIFTLSLRSQHGLRLKSCD